MVEPIVDCTACCQSRCEGRAPCKAAEHADRDVQAVGARAPLERVADTRFFGPAIVESFSQRVTLPSELVVQRELTRATSLSYKPNTRAAFTDELRALLDQSSEIGLEQHTPFTMAQRHDD